MGWLERADERNQRRAERDQAMMGGDDWAERLDASEPGPRWAWAISGLPLVGWIGILVLLICGGRDAWRRRKRA